MISNVANDSALIAAVDLVLAPESKVTIKQLPPTPEGKKCFHAIAEKNGQKVEAFLLMKLARRLAIVFLAGWISLGLITKRLFAQSNSPYSFTSVGGTLRLIWSYPFEIFYALRFNNVRFVGMPGAWSGDIGAQIIAAYNDLPPTGGRIHVVDGIFSFTTPIVFATAGKCPLVTGSGRISTVLQWSGSTSATAVTFDCYGWPSTLGGGVSSGFGLRDIRLWNSGSAGTTVGLQLGTSNGAAGWYGENLDVVDFNTNLNFGTNTWNTSCVKCLFDLPGTSNMLLPNSATNSGESIGFLDSTFSNSLSGNGAYKTNCIVISLGSIVTFKGGSIDNCQLVVNQASPIVELYGVNMEDPLATNVSVPYLSVSTAATVSLFGGTFLQDASSATVPTAFASVSAGALSINEIWASNVSTTQMYTVQVSGSGTLAEYGTVASSGNMQSAVYTGSTSGGSISTLNKGSIYLTGSWNAASGRFSHAGVTNVTPESLAGGWNLTLPAQSGTIQAEITGQNIDLTAQAANIGSTSLYAIPSNRAGLYRVSCYLMETRAATTSSTLPSCVIGWTDKDNSTRESVTFTAGAPTGNSLSTFLQSSAVVNAKASTNINYSTTSYASVGGIAMLYAIHIRIEAL